MSVKKEHILVIRLGALGDMIFCLQSFYEIRLAHPKAEIALLTRAPFVEFARTLPWIDHVIIETHPRFTNILAWIRLQREIVRFAPDLVYDLQGKKRQTILFALLGGPFGPAWSGAAPFCKFPRPWPPQPDMHFQDFLAAQLRSAGVKPAPAADLNWLNADVKKYRLGRPYIVLIPGCSPLALHKRWPPEAYAELAYLLRDQGFSVVTIGTDAETKSIESIHLKAPHIINLCGQTDLLHLAGLLRQAAAVIGNDTGPLHLAAAVGCPVLALFSNRSHAVWSKPPGIKVSVLQRPSLKDLKAYEVNQALIDLLASNLQ